MIAEKCINITGYDQFLIEKDTDFLSIITNSSTYHYDGENQPKASNSTTAPLIGIKSEKNMYISFQR